MQRHLIASFRLPAAGLGLALGTIAVLWMWIGAPVPMPPSPLSGGERLHCVSYAPFRDYQNPLDPATRVSPAQIDDDLTRLSRLTNCVRTYAIEHGLDQIPEIARRHGMTMMLGVWLGRLAEKNRIEIETAIALAKRYPDVVRSIVVGNEVLLRGEISPQDLANTIRAVKAQVTVPVTYADVWEFWLRHREVYDAVDFVTIHILPYWEDYPISADRAADHVGSIRRQVATAFPNKEILIGETGWPSEGRMREGALPSPVNQARVMHEVLALAKRENFRVNVIEAFDQPWKRYLEGTVGGHWGLLDATSRSMKFGWGEPLSNHPFWRWQMFGGMMLAVAAFAAGFCGRGRDAAMAWQPWLGVAICAAVAGCMAPLAIEKVPVESLGIGGWMRSLTFAALAVAVPVTAAAALTRAVTPPPFSRLFGRVDHGATPVLARLLGLLLAATSLISIQVALGLAFDPRYRDFPYAPLTAALVPFVVLTAMLPRSAGERGVSETAAAGTLILCALYVVFNEGFANWQSLWFCAAIAVLAINLLLVRGERS